ncbi:MAG TPA: hypothetical protein VFR59_05700 [Steroidobacteraceae bacterium]|nr:hypothetical protein [Steroidobacteraceae bacterium]
MASNRTRARRTRLRCAMAATVTLPVCLLAQAQDARSADENASSTASSPDTRCPEQAQVDSGRRSPSVPVLPWEPTPCEPARLPALPSAALADFAAIPDRWRVVSMLGYDEDLLDPYSGNNWLKGDRPAWGEDWFVNLLLISDSVAEPRSFAAPVGGPVSEEPGSLDTIGNGEQFVFSQSLIVEGVIYKGNTVFKPPDYEFRFTPVFNVNYAQANEAGVLKADPGSDTSRTEGVIGVQALFVDKHLRNVSERYDFDSLRVGIQPFTSDFRGFLFQDSAPGVRLFGTRADNRYQYNLGWFRRMEKDTNSGLNNLLELGADSLRDDDLFVANLYAQDFPFVGFTSQATVIHNRNREGDEVVYDDNGIIQRPASIGLELGRDYEVTYAGVSGDGHFGRWNLSASVYGAFGESTRGLFVDQPQDIVAGFGAAELSRDFDWIRVRASLAYGSADEDPFDDRAGAFDAIFENPLFAGADTSFWIRQPVPLIGGGRVGLSGRNGLLNSLRPSKEFGQSNFENPGLVLAGIGADFDLTPTTRVSVNANHLAFADTAVLEVARAQAPIDREIGQDISFALIWRPLATQNIVVRASGAVLIPGSGYEQLFGDEFAYSVLANVVLTY